MFATTPYQGVMLGVPGACHLLSRDLSLPPASLRQGPMRPYPKCLDGS